jgi:aconitase B
MSNTTFEQAKKVLEDLGYVVDVAHISTVTDHYECTDEDAREVLEGVYEVTWHTIKERVHDRCENLEFKNKDE